MNTAARHFVFRGGKCTNINIANKQLWLDLNPSSNDIDTLYKMLNIEQNVLSLYGSENYKFFSPLS